MPADAVIGKHIKSKMTVKYLAVFRIIMNIFGIMCDINLWPVCGGSDIPEPLAPMRFYLQFSASHGFL